jgi:uncharacterized protein (DUF2147 family)
MWKEWFYMVCFFYLSLTGSHAIKDMKNPAVARWVMPGFSPDAILGEWTDEKSTVTMAIYKENGFFHARIAWIKDKPIAAVGSSLVRNLSYAGNNYWNNGELFYPKTKTWYRCHCFLVEKSVLRLRVFSGTPFFGKTLYFLKTGH